MPLSFVLGIITVSLFVIGLMYSFIIYHWPIYRTYVEVVVGVGFTVSGEMLATYAVLRHYGLLELWWIVTFPAAAFIITGSSMIAFQEYKYHSERRKAREIERKFNGELDG